MQIFILNISVNGHRINPDLKGAIANDTERLFQKIRDIDEEIAGARAKLNILKRIAMKNEKERKERNRGRKSVRNFRVLQAIRTF